MYISPLIGTQCTITNFYDYVSLQRLHEQWLNAHSRANCKLKGSLFDVSSICESNKCNIKSGQLQLHSASHDFNCIGCAATLHTYIMPSHLSKQSTSSASSFHFIRVEHNKIHQKDWAGLWVRLPPIAMAAKVRAGAAVNATTVAAKCARDPLVGCLTFRTCTGHCSVGETFLSCLPADMPASIGQLTSNKKVAAQCISIPAIHHQQPMCPQTCRYRTAAASSAGSWSPANTSCHSLTLNQVALL